ncbi:substrate-binding domain-containing protein [Limosilactobacillus alvi]|uniref:substrate-binding domain-containing protein n=1 Tax=Limosilactobacillus alvi TaxID=990412 RepID=UPI001EF42D32|nr:substrate-binding domain-containing protein [Limosilactobacillus alvi]
MLTMRPEISRIKQDSREIGKRAASLLHQKIEHPDQVPKQPDTIVIPTSLIIKNSF